MLPWMCSGPLVLVDAELEPNYSVSFFKRRDRRPRRCSLPPCGPLANSSSIAGARSLCDERQARRANRRRTRNWRRASRDRREVRRDGHVADELPPFVGDVGDRCVGMEIERIRCATPPSKRTWPLHERLEGEEAELLVAAVRQIFLVAAQVDILMSRILDAACPAPAATLVLDDIGAHLAAVGEEARADRRPRGSSSSWWYFEIPPRNSKILKKPPIGNVGADVAARLAPVEDWLLGLARRDRARSGSGRHI